MTTHRLPTRLARVLLLTVLLAAGFAVSAAAQSPTASGTWRNRNPRCHDRITRGEEANADRYLDRHPRIDRQLERDPRLIDNPRYVRDHPSLQSYLWNHPNIRQDWKQRPYAFERRQQQYDRNEYRTPYTAQR